MSSPLRDRIRAAALSFAEELADALEKSAATPYVSQQTCAPLKPRTFLRLIAEGKLHATKQGKLRLVLRTEFEALLASTPRLTREQETGEPDEDTAMAERLGLRKVR